MIFTKIQYERFSNRKFFFPLVSISAFILMVSGLIPFEAVLIPLVTVRPKKWMPLAITSVIGSAVGAMTLAALSRHLGWPVNVFKVLGAFVLGKSIKYGIISYLVMRGELSIQNHWNHNS